ncbi:MAG: hypothetical protein ACETWQ_19845 [Phycisphaerae bacterium]
MFMIQLIMKINPIGHLVKTNPIQTQFKPNLVRRRRIANVYDTKDYRKNDDFAVRKNKPNLKRAKMDVNIYYTEIYENISNWTLGENKPNQSQFSSRNFKNIDSIAQRVYNCVVALLVIW